ncbi:plant intracellular Ras-group-related LRR protein 4 [Beta vulgaris subsp. vulgaris]|uniref:plant intracellular Ras-group-related LRR protein 4 n=1 Tax=Beta vulgaris subsp. vulgaris TaxID=3555 RepID=UPI002037609D|nr:plant intracellular Ras-group-related LRR protein 4 [Beta vulgaris subsp. vulgaris]XP_010680639.2 plant intracellular Ras-group-related LRR protein 4 [Beta vulgaris subsp. vulgaris]
MDNFTTAAAKTVDGMVEQIMHMHKALPARPDIEEVEAAKTLIQNIEREDQLKLEAISKQTKGKFVPEELFFIYQEMQKALFHFQSKEQKREAMKLLDLENAHNVFDELIQRASQCVLPNSDSGVSSSSVNKKDLSVGGVSGVSSVLKSRDLETTSVASTSSFYNLEKREKEGGKKSELFTRDDTYVNKSQPISSSSVFHVDGFKTSAPASQLFDSTNLKTSNYSGQDGEKLSLIKLASLIEVSAKKGTKELNLQNKLLDQVEWLPDSIGKLSGLVTLDLSENRVVALPVTIGGLSSLSKLDLHSNRIAELPEAIGDLLNLVYLDLRGNFLAKLPPSVGKLFRLEELDLSSNRLTSLPDTIGSLVSLKKLNAETNDLEELPHTIGLCSSLEEITVAYNRIRALPEAVGKIESLEVLSVRYNNIRQLPTTMSSLNRLKELDVSFNELEAVPESLCFATSLVKLNVSNNFADLRYLPRSIGNLEMLEVLDISNNQIRNLPESFRLLTRLRVLHTDQNPLELPPRNIAEKGAQAVVQYMADLFANKDVKVQPTKQKKSWAQICFFSRSNKRKRGGVDYVKT